jgi:hypothetical protein
MVLGGADLQAALSLIHQVAAQDAVPQLPPVSALIETPSPVFPLRKCSPESTGSPRKRLKLIGCLSDFGLQAGIGFEGFLGWSDRRRVTFRHRLSG